MGNFPIVLAMKCCKEAVTNTVPNLLESTRYCFVEAFLVAYLVEQLDG
jgi:hypothetical protein